jgi:molybdenum cofactor biosynthesis enzyme MoaA
MTPEEQASFGSELTTEEWIELGKAAVKEGMIYLLITGGEPLLRPDFAEIYAALVQMGLFVSINTNGTLITPEIVEVFQKYRPEKVNVTLYGMSDTTYGHLCGNADGYKKALEGIRMLKEAKIRVGISTTFTSHNAEAWKNTCESVKTLYLPAECTNCKYQSLCPMCAAISSGEPEYGKELVADMCARTQTYIEEFLKGSSET